MKTVTYETRSGAKVEAIRKYRESRGHVVNVECVNGVYHVTVSIDTPNK